MNPTTNRQVSCRHHRHTPARALAGAARPTLILHIIAVAIAVMAAASCSHCGRQPGRADAAITDSLLETAAARNASGDKQGAISLIDSTLNMRPADTTRCMLLCEKTVAQIDMGLMREAVTTGHEAMALAEKTANSEAALNVYGSLGIAYRRMGMLDSALVMYRSGMERAVKERDSEYEMYLANCVSVLFTEQGHYRQAMDYARRAEKSATAAHDTIEALSAHATIGAIYMWQKQYRQAVRVLEGRWTDARSTGYNVLMLKYLSPLLKSLSMLGDTRRLSHYMREADQAMQGMSATSNGVLGILEIKAAMLGSEGKRAEQLVLLDSLLATNRTNRAMPLEKLMRQKAECLRAMGRGAEAFRLMDSAYQTLDSVKQTDIDRNMSEFTARYDTMEKEMRLEQANRLNAEQKLHIMWLAAAVAALLAIVAVVLYSRKLTAQRALLKARPSYIEGMEQERERMARELHDGVCNDILATTMLLSADPAAADSHLRGVWRDVRHLSHALMPPRFSHATLREAVESYVSSVSSDNEQGASTGNTPCHIQLHISSYDWASLPHDTAYQLYRIIQEATANALKHGCGQAITVELLHEDGHIVVRVTNDVAVDSTNGGSAHAESAAQTATDAQGIGLHTLQARAESIGATLRTATSHGQHTVELTL